MRRAVPLVLALLVVLSGCSAFGGDTPSSEATTTTVPAATTSAVSTSATTTGTPSPTDTSTPETTDTPTPTPQPPAELAPGVTEAGVENRSALVRAHESALLADGFRTRLVVENRSSDAANRSTKVAVAGSAGVPIRVTTNRSSGVAVERWDNGTAVHTRRVGADTTYKVRNGTLDASSLSLPGRVRDALNATADSLAVTRIRSANGTDEVTLSTAANGGEAASEINHTLVVTVDGLITRARLVERLGDDRTRTTRYAVREEGDVDPERPAWVDDAPATGTIDASLDVRLADNTFVRVRNGGPDDLPEGSTIRLLTDEGTYEAQTTFTHGVSDVDWAYLRRSELQFTRTRPDDANRLPRAFRLVVESPAGAELFNESFER